MTTIAQCLAQYSKVANDPVNSPEMRAMAKHRLDWLMKDAPSGSGFDAGTKLRLEQCNENKIVLFTEFHHMNEHGYYDGWTYHKVTVKASLAYGFDLVISGRNRNDIKEYIGQMFQEWLDRDVDFSLYFKKEIA